jgi:phage baseplate assembly protein V
MNELIRVGRISSIAPDKCAARVTFADKAEVVSFDLPILVRGSLETKDYWMPVVKEQVVCLFLPNGNANGFILGSFYSSQAPPVTDEKKRHIAFPDGTHIEYDMTLHKMTIHAAGEIHIEASGNVHVTGDVIADGVSLKNHVHTGVTLGTADSGKPKGGV